MQGDRIEKLFFLIELIDKVTQPSKSAKDSMLIFQKNFRSVAKDISTGGASIYSAFAGLDKCTRSTREFDRATQEVQSLGVAPAELDKLRGASKDFSAQFGGDATEIVRSAYDIQSAIPGLKDGALAAFTTNSAMLAKATKATSADMTNYMGTMYNIFEKEIGDKPGEWVAALAGKTAEAVKIFKTTGPAMNQAFSSLGSTGQVVGVKMEEQMAVLGTLQATMGGANAGTAYKGFLNKLSQGQQTLKLNFKGSDGQLLPVYDILDKIQGKIGKLDKDKQVAVLTQAFGETGAQAVMNMLSKTDQLKTSIAGLSAIKNNDPAQKMAETMVDQMDRFQGAWNSLKISFGVALLPAVNAIIGSMATLSGQFAYLMDIFPPLRWATVAAAGSVFLLVTAFGAIKIALGIESTISLLCGLIKSLSKTTGFAATKTAILTVWTKIHAAAVWLNNVALNASIFVYRKCAAAMIFLRTTTVSQAAAMLWNRTVMIAHAVGSGIMTAATWLLNGGLIAATGSVWAFTVALLANPIGLVVAAVLALVAAVVMICVYFDEINEFLPGLADYLLICLGPIGWIAELFMNWDNIPAIFERMWAGLNKVYDTIADKLVPVVQWFNKLFGGGETTVDAKVSGGISGAGEPVLANAATARNHNRDVQPGGVRNTTTNNNRNYGGVTINTASMRPSDLEEWAYLQA